ncbi:hypothetical protein DY000_02010965 [Brassica cretica]|uniref:Uncharacterized protein n=1 Tax=Brassica cretica TaxID=69181 RepID=A0ABQ7D028_BRACR|nr:hypothetical protein DY000_02010965 [Brassica cretica]
MVLKACAVASWTDRDSSNLRRLDGSIFSSSQTLLSHDGKGRVFNRLERKVMENFKTDRDLSNLEEVSSVVPKPCAAVTAREGCSAELGREPKAELDPEDEEESDGEIEEDRIEESEDDKIDLLEVPEWDVGTASMV